jgi:hypothetical protein
MLHVNPDPPSNVVEVEVRMLISACVAVFVVILGVSAWWDPTIRVLHLFEAVPYIAAAALGLRRKKFGYLLGIAAGALWLWIAGTRTTFVRQGFAQAGILLQTGQIPHPDVLIAAPAALSTGGLALFSLWGYVRLRNKSWMDLALAAAAAGLVLAYFIAIFAAFAPRFLRLIPFLA